MEKFKELVQMCKASVSLSVNSHKDYYESVQQHIIEEDIKNIDEEVFNEMIKKDTVVSLQVYPHTPIGFFVIYHHDIETAIDIALNELKNM